MRNMRKVKPLKTCCHIHQVLITIWTIFNKSILCEVFFRWNPTYHTLQRNMLHALLHIPVKKVSYPNTFPSALKEYFATTASNVISILAACCNLYTKSTPSNSTYYTRQLFLIHQLANRLQGLVGQLAMHILNFLAGTVLLHPWISRHMTGPSRLLHATFALRST